MATASHDLRRPRERAAAADPVHAAEPDGLAKALADRVRGEVRFDRGSRALYATDASNYRQVPIGVVIPRDAEDVMNALESCRAYGAPVLGRGGGTSLAGQGCNAGAPSSVMCIEVSSSASLRPLRRGPVVARAFRTRCREHCNAVLVDGRRRGCRLGWRRRAGVVVLAFYYARRPAGSAEPPSGNSYAYLDGRPSSRRM